MLAELNPLHQTVELVRAAVLYGFEWNDLAARRLLVLFALVMWRIAIHAMTKEADRLSEIRIEPWGEGDLPLLEQLMGDPAMTEHLGGPESPEKIAERQERYEHLPETGTGGMFKIVDADDGRGRRLGRLLGARAAPR